MGTYLTSTDCAALEAVTGAVLSPLSASSLEEWRREVACRLRELFGAEQTLMVVCGSQSRAFCDEDPSLAADVESHIREVSSGIAPLAGILFGEAAPTPGPRGQIVVSDFTRNQDRSPLRSLVRSLRSEGIVERHGVSRSAGLIAGTREYGIGAFVLFQRPDRMQSIARCESLLRLILPAFASAVESMNQRDALRAALDVLSDAVIVIGSDCGVLYRNEAFARIVAADPEVDLLQKEIRRTASALYVSALRNSTGDDSQKPGAVIRRVVTDRAQYDLTAKVLPAGLFGDGSSVVVTVTRQGPPELPAADVLRDRFGLTRREAEVALRLAGGSSNVEIASALFLSPHTARRHTANVFSKLGVKSRKGLALWLLSQ